jgi:hypothetical protein
MTTVALLGALPLLSLPDGGTAPPEPPGKPMTDAFFREAARRARDRCLAGIDSREAWTERRGRLRDELREMLGLVPEPPRGDLRAVTTGTIERADLGIAVEKLHFQSVPGLYVTANYYRPLRVEGRLPAVLYLCGHGQVKVDGVSFGNKAFYQHHPAWFARNGYACLVIDTLQLGEIEGKHHGIYRLDQWWWVSRGYTPAGLEAWNSIRALDYLETRPEVDPRRIGVTGRSGGGIGTWWLAALDDRPAVLVPVAGITDLENHLADGCIDGHCDCNFPVNLYGWDYPALAALAAPRPLLFANTDKDAIFPLSGVLRVHEKLRGIYGLLGAADRLGLCIVEGPHKDTQELQVPAFRWMERWLKGTAEPPPVAAAEKPFDPKDLRVFREAPADERNTTIEESFVAVAKAPVTPRTIAELDALRSDLVARLKARVFRQEPDPDAPLELELVASSERGGLRLRCYRFLAEAPFRLPIWVLSRHGETVSHAAIEIAGEDGLKEWISALAPAFAKEIGADPSSGDPRKAAALEARLGGEKGLALVVLPPRGIGPTRFALDAKTENQVRRRFLALGRTLESCRVHDARRAARAVASIAELSGARLSLAGEGPMAAVAVYAGIFEPGIASFDLRGLPESHRQAVPLINVLKVLDIPQAAALLFPRKVILTGARVEAFRWTLDAAALFGRESPLEVRPAGAPVQVPVTDL